MKQSSEKELVNYSVVEQFHAARLRGKLEQIGAVLTGKTADLLSYDEVRTKVHAIETNKRELRSIPLDSIVGSVGRYKDFTRRFFPLVEGDEFRWARVHTLTTGMEGLPPIEVYQIGEVYFVRDGNHRVSVARELGASQIEAYVTQVYTPVALELGIEPDDLIIKERYAHFLEQTDLKNTYPNLDLSMSAAGNYRVLEQQIKVHQKWLKEQQVDVSFTEAASRWYQSVYWPVVQIIRSRGIMRDFPDRTETDLYVWVEKHRRELAEQLNWTVDAKTAVLDLADQYPVNTGEAIQLFGEKVLDALIPTPFETGPAIGEWRNSWLATYREDRLFSHILVAIDGKDTGWHALQQALRVARWEEGKIFGLHLVQTPEAANSKLASGVKAEFDQRCQEAGIAGELTIAVGPVSDTICYRAKWADLVVVSLSQPPGPKPIDRLGSKFSHLLRRCPRPVLAVPTVHTELNRMLLAYDGSPKADEALFVAAYLAEQWNISLFVVVALSRRVTANAAERVRKYLEDKGIESQFVVKKSSAANLIIDTAQENDCGLILMGGYGLIPVIEIVVGSIVDEILRTRNWPILICR